MTKKKRDEFLFGGVCSPASPLGCTILGYDQKKEMNFYLGGCVAQHPLLDAPLFWAMTRKKR